MAKARRLIAECVISVWTTEEAPDPDTESDLWRVLCQDVDAAISRTVGVLSADTTLKNLTERGIIALEVEEES